ncbi:class I SAM-dependent methyltransferase [Candidatus Marinimicrobia bacterium]|nr:class I SAM-dependent methyltransferase [Candidatus Neomarinimicrobiota bacterium]
MKILEHSYKQNKINIIGEKFHRGKDFFIFLNGSEKEAKIYSEKGFNVIQNFLEDVEVEDLPNSKKCFVSCELFEHLHNPENFLLKLNELMNSKDLFILTTLSSLGIDIQVLWENSPSVSPPHHLNFFNPKSIKKILDRTGFEQIDVSSPGKLDIDILINNKKYVVDRFLKTFIETASEAEKESWQINVTNSSWSSHMMVVCQKK